MKSVGRQPLADMVWRCQGVDKVLPTYRGGLHYGKRNDSRNTRNPSTEYRVSGVSAAR